MQIIRRFTSPLIGQLMMATALFMCNPTQAATFGFFAGQSEALGYLDGQFIGEYASIINCIHTSTQTNDDKVVALPAPRLFQQLSSGDIDVGYGLGANAERDQYATASNPMLYLELWFLTDRLNTNHTDLSGMRVATVRSSFFVPMIQQAGGIPIQLESYDQAVRMAHSNRADGAMVISAARKSMDMTLVDEMRKTVITKEPVVAYVSKQSIEAESLLNRLNAAIDECTE